MTYHETFWVAAAAAAPVIALANTVSLGDAGNIWFDINKFKHSPRSLRIITLLFAVPSVNLMLQTTVLGMSMLALYDKSDDSYSVWPVIIFLTSGLIFVLLTSILVMMTKSIFIQEEKAEEKRRAREASADEHSHKSQKASGLGWPSS